MEEKSSSSSPSSNKINNTKPAPGKQSKAGRTSNQDIPQNIVYGKMPEDQQVSEHIRQSGPNHSEAKAQKVQAQRRYSGLSSKSDNNEFVDFKISNIKQGMFEFTEVQKNEKKNESKKKGKGTEKNNDKKDLKAQNETKQKDSRQVQALKHERLQIVKPKEDSKFQKPKQTETNKLVENNQIKNQQNASEPSKENKKSGSGWSKVKTATNALKVVRTVGSHKKLIQSEHESYKKDFSSILLKMKSVNLVFSHFCKDNNFTSIKSTLFEDKPKLMSEMSLNKWMVFCKQFQIIQKLYSVKSGGKTKTISENHSSLEGQKARQLIKMRELKDVEANLVAIFKSVSNSKAKINFEGFVAGIFKIFEQFKQTYSHQGGQAQFLEEVLHCASEKQSLKKLSQLKFTHATPQISYEKSVFPDISRNIFSKSRLKKQNQTQNQLGNRRPNHNKSMPGSMDKLKLNSVLQEAKNTLLVNKTEESKYSNKKDLKKKYMKPREYERDENGVHKKLVEYFQSNNDEILDNYFKLQGKGCKKPKDIIAD